MVSFLKKAKKETPSVKRMLHEHLNGPEQARPLFRVHASELTKPDGMCPRYYALSDVTKTKPWGGWLSTSEQITFSIGRELQDAVVNWFADMGRAFCHWKCLGCNQVHQFQLRPDKCSTCGAKNFKPEEVRFQSAVNGASCGIDMLLAMGEKKMRPVEIKTIAPDAFKALLAPLAEHKWRTNLYLRIIEESEEPWSNSVNSQLGTVLYVSKGGYGIADPILKEWGLKESFSPLKEWDVERNDADTDSLSDRAKVVKDFRAGLVGMPCGICPTALAKKATKCSVKVACFSGDHPAEYDWTKK